MLPPLGHLRHIHHNPFLIYVKKLTFTMFLWLQHLESLKWQPCPRISYYIYNCIYIQFNFKSSVVTIPLFCCTLMFAGQLQLLIIHLCKIAHSFITETQGRNTLYTLLSVHELSNRCAVNNHQ